MKRARFLWTSFFAAAAAAQQPPVHSSLLDHLVGRWELAGTLAHKQTVHDVTADWVLQHHYVRVHEVSREKKADGSPQYEAWLYIASNDEPKTYSIAWLDVFGGLTKESIGVAPKMDSEMPFAFKDEKGSVTFENDFFYDANSDTWQWRLDNVKDGKAVPFGRVTLTRKR